MSGTKPTELTDVLSAREVLATLRAFRRGDFSKRLWGEHAGIAGEIAVCLNDVIEIADNMATELGRVRPGARAPRRLRAAGVRRERFGDEDLDARAGGGGRRRGRAR